MKIAAILLSVLFASQSFAQAPKYHVIPGAKMLFCKANSKVDVIDSIFITETSTPGQLCGNYTRSMAPTPQTSYPFCIKGELLGAENVLNVTSVRYGVDKISLRYDEKKGFTLVNAFECNWNSEEHCIPGGEEILAEEVVDCHVSILRY